MAQVSSIPAQTFAAGQARHESYFLATFSGFARVSHFRADWWAVCPDENGGMGLSFCCGPDTRVYTAGALVEVFGSMAEANAAIVGAGGNMATALRRAGRGELSGSERCDLCGKERPAALIGEGKTDAGQQVRFCIDREECRFPEGAELES